MRTEGSVLQLTQQFKLPRKHKEWLGKIADRELFVDKSMIIKDIIQEKSYPTILITRPNNWGKQTIISMLRTFLQYSFEGATGEQNKHYLEQRQKIFLTLEISKDKTFNFRQHLGKYIVISFNMNIRYCSPNQMIFHFIQVIVQFLRDHAYLRAHESNFYEKLISQFKDYDPFKKGNVYLEYLVYLKRLFDQQKIIFLIENYDYNYTIDLERLSKFQKSKQNPAEKKNMDEKTDQIVHLIRKLSKISYKTVVTGVRNLFKNKHHDIQDDSLHCPRFGFNKYFGFTQNEIKQCILKKMFKSSTQSNIQAIEMLFSTIKKVYQGYNSQFQGNKSIVFNPYSVILYLKACFEKSPPRIIEQAQYKKQLSMRGSPLYWLLIQCLIDDLNKQQLDQLQYYLASTLASQKQVITIDKIQNKESIFSKAKDWNACWVIYNFLANGFLGYEDQTLKILNAESREFIYQMTTYCMVVKLRIQQTKVQSIDFQRWSLLKQKIQAKYEEFLSYSILSEQIFNAIWIASLRFLKNTEYRVDEGGKLCLMFIPYHEKNRLVLHKHKVLVSEASRVESELRMKFEEAFTQIFMKNYFEKALQRGRWRDMIVRAVVGIRMIHKQNQQYLIEGQEHYFTRGQIKMIHDYWKKNVQANPQPFIQLKARFPQNNIIKLLRFICKTQARRQNIENKNQYQNQGMMEALRNLNIAASLQSYCHTKSQEEKNQEFNQSINEFKQEYTSILYQLGRLEDTYDQTLQMAFGGVHADILRYLIDISLGRDIRPERQLF